MKPLSVIISIVVLASSILLAEDSVDQSGVGAKGKQVQSDPAPVLPIPDQARFEYKVLELDSSDTLKESALNELGRQGWELVTVTSVFIPNGGSLNRAYLKRTLREPTAHLKK
jgi:hypothetical protein